MTLEPTAWRTNDAVTFDAAREALNRATATLFELADRGVLELDVAVEQATSLRLQLLALDGFDRPAVDGFIDEIGERLARLRLGER